MDMDEDKQVEINKIGKKHRLSGHQMDQLAATFSEADEDGSGTIEMQEFCKVFEVKNGVLAKSIWDLYDEDKSKSVDFGEFVEGLATTLDIKTEEEKIQWAFDLYDLNKDGDLSFMEMERCLKDTNVGIPWDKKSLKGIFSEKAFKKNVITRKEFTAVAKTCPTLTYPAFIMLDTLKNKAFDMKEATAKSDAQKDLETAKNLKRERRKSGTA